MDENIDTLLGQNYKIDEGQPPVSNAPENIECYVYSKKKGINRKL